MGHDVFLSHASEDRAFAEALVNALESGGVSCWIAPRDLLPGQDYAEALVDALDRCRVFVLLLSARSNESPHVRREAERAASRGVPIVPIRIEDVALSKSLQYFVGSSHWTDALEPPMEKHVPRIAEAVRRHLGAQAARTPEAPPSPAAPAPGAASRSRAWLLAGGAVALAAAGAFWMFGRRGDPAPGAGPPGPGAGPPGPGAGPPGPGAGPPGQAAAAAPGSGAIPVAAPSAASACSDAGYLKALDSGSDKAERRMHFGAHAAFKEALKLCPGSPEAQAGLKREKLALVREYREKAEAEWGKGDFWGAHFNYDIALGYWPGSETDEEYRALKLKDEEALTQFHKGRGR